MPRKHAEPLLTPYSSWTPPALLESSPLAPVCVKLSLSPTLKERPDEKAPALVVPLIDVVKKNYIPRLRYEAFLEEDKEFLEL